MRVYISGKITGDPDYENKFHAAAALLEKNGFRNYVNPAYNTKTMPQATHEEYMQVSMKLLELCDAIYPIPGWEESAGAQEEMCYAREHRYTILKYQMMNRGDTVAESKTRMDRKI